MLVSPLRHVTNCGSRGSADNILPYSNSRQDVILPINIAFVDRHPIVLAGMTKIFSDDSRFRIMGVGVSLADAQSIVTKHNPDVLIVDFSLDVIALDNIRTMVREFIREGVILFTDQLSIGMIVRALELGISGVISKTANVIEILGAVDNVNNGKLSIPNRYACEVISALTNKKCRDDRVSDQFNFREIQIIDQLCAAKTNREIAQNLEISEKTVKRYITNLMQKMNARNRVELAIQAQKRAAKE